MGVPPPKCSWVTGRAVFSSGAVRASSFSSQLTYSCDEARRVVMTVVQPQYQHRDSQNGM